MLVALVLSESFAIHQSRAADRLRREQQQTQDALTHAREQSTLADTRSQALKLQLARGYLQRGQLLCDQGEVAHGLLWMARSLETLPPDHDDLEQVILDDVTDGPDLLVEAPASFHVERFRHGDLHVVDMVAVPERLEERVRKPEIEQILHRLLREVVVDAKDGRFLERGMQRPVESPGRREVASERLLDHDACA